VLSQLVLTEEAPLVTWLRRFRRLTVFVVEVVTTAAAGVLAFLLRFDLHLPPAYHSPLMAALAVWIPVKLACFNVLGVDRGSWRYASAREFLKLIAGDIAATGMSTLTLLLLTNGIPRSIYVLQFLLSVLIGAALRVLPRMLKRSNGARALHDPPKTTLIYGAGDAGVALVRELDRNSMLYQICGFVDDQKHKTGLAVRGLRVLGTGNTLAAIVKKHRIELVLIAVPSATGAQMINILKHCQTAAVRYKTIPNLADRIEENDLLLQVRDVAVEDLLGRPPVRLDVDPIHCKIESRTILVTGAAGSIGSELCRQIARFRPDAIIGFDIAETALFYLEQEMERSCPFVRFYPELGSIQDPQRLAEVFEKHRPSLVYHAAAYKHVPLMESHLFQAIENNIFGTLNVALAAGRSGVEDFVMISSDKAVRPSNIMGVTKRIAELLVRSLPNGQVKYVSVRFGNVLGSNGSVVPIFKQQISRGGPLTVTDPDVTRYFMTIPEASQLVLQSSTMGKGGEIFVLDMGEPVRIVDLARNLILLSGLRPDEDIKIEFTGLRPGEKLYEELNMLNESTLPTRHEKIRIFAGRVIPWSTMEPQLKQLRRLSNARCFNEALEFLQGMVPDYNPGADLLRLSRQLRAYEAGVEVGSSK